MNVPITVAMIVEMVATRRLRSSASTSGRSANGCIQLLSVKWFQTALNRPTGALNENATITKIVSNPISIRQAFWSPYKKLVRLIEEQIAKRAAAADADAALKALSVTGLFSNVSTSFDAATGTLTIRVTENPIVNQVVFEGNVKVSDKDLTKEVQIKVGTGEHDQELKAKKAAEWLAEGHRVRAELFLKGRYKGMDEKFLMDRLDGHGGFVDQDANGQRQAAQGHQVDGLSGHPEPARREQQ